MNEVQVSDIHKHIMSNRQLRNPAEVTTEVEMSEMTVKVISYHIEKSKRLEAEKAALLDEKRVMLPKAKVYDRIADASGTKSIQEVAAQMNIGSNTLFAVLRDKGILFREGSSNLPKREHIEAGRFIVVEEPFRVSGEDRVYSRTRVTPKGELWLAQIIEKGA